MGDVEIVMKLAKANTRIKELEWALAEEGALRISHEGHIGKLEKVLLSVRNETMCEGAGRTLQRIAKLVDRVLPSEPSGPSDALTGKEAKGG